MTAKIIEDYAQDNLKKMDYPILELNPFIPPTFEILWDDIDKLKIMYRVLACSSFTYPAILASFDIGDNLHIQHLKMSLLKKVSSKKLSKKSSSKLLVDKMTKAKSN